MLTFRKGEDVYVDVPYSTAVRPERLGDTCNWCFAHPCPTEIKCSSCSKITYCSSKCQAKDSVYHEFECLYHRNFTPDVHRLKPITLRTLSRALKDRESDSPTESYFFEHRRTIGDLLTHAEEFPPFRRQRFVDCTADLAQLLSENGHVISKDLIMELIMKIVINAHSVRVWDSLEGTYLGQALYLGGSKMNHTCEILTDYMPMFRGNRIVMKALKDFSLTNSLDLVTHYIPVLRERDTRRSHLSGSYYFDCECPRCVRESGDSRSVISFLIERLIDNYTCKKTLDKLKIVEPRLSDIPISDTLRYGVWLRLLYFDKRQSLERSLKVGLAAYESAPTPSDRMVILHILCIDMAYFGADQPSHEYYSKFKKYHEMSMRFFMETVGEGPLLEKMRSLDAKTRNSLFVPDEDDVGKKESLGDAKRDMTNGA